MAAVPPKSVWNKVNATVNPPTPQQQQQSAKSPLHADANGVAKPSPTGKSAAAKPSQPSPSHAAGKAASGKQAQPSPAHAQSKQGGKSAPSPSNTVVSSPSPSPSPAAPSPVAAKPAAVAPAPTAAAEPTTSPSPSTDLSSILQIGNTVTVKSASGAAFTGSVFVYDSATCALALELTRGDGDRDCSLFNTATVTVSLVVKGDTSAHRSLPQVDQQRLAAKESKAISDRQMEAAKIGPSGVSTEGQRIFDALSKQYPARWESNVIVLMDSMKLSSPYDTKSLTGGNSQQQQRITKVIQAERAKMGLQ